MTGGSYPATSTGANRALMSATATRVMNLLLLAPPIQEDVLHLECSPAATRSRSGTSGGCRRASCGRSRWLCGVISRT